MAAVSGLTLTISSGSDGAAVTTGNSTFSAVTGALLIETDWAPTGTRSLRCTTTASANMSGRLQAAAPLTTAYFGGAIQLRGEAGGTVTLAEVKDDTNAVKAQVQRTADGLFRLRNSSQTPVGSTSAYIPDATDSSETGEYWVRLQITGSTMRAYLYPLGSSTAIWDSGSVSYTAGSFTRLSLGFNAAVANSDVAFNGWSADDAAPVSQPVTAPVVDAGSDKSADVATKVSIDATITSGSGTQGWTHVSGPTVTFSDSTAVDTDVTNTGGAGDSVLRLTDGVSSDTVTIHWAALTTTAGVQGIESAGDWADTANLTDDDVDTQATITDASADAVGLRLSNRLTPSGDVNIKLRGVTQTGTHTVDWSLRKHDKSTVVKGGTGVSVSGDAVTIAIDSGDLSGMGTDWAHEDGWGGYLILTASAV